MYIARKVGIINKKYLEENLYISTTTAEYVYLTANGPRVLELSFDPDTREIIHHHQTIKESAIHAIKKQPFFL